MRIIQDYKAFRYIDIFPSVVKQVNVSIVPDISVVAGWHHHSTFDDYYLVLKGSFEVGVVSNILPPIFYSLSERYPEVFRVLGSTYHGFRALEPNSILLYGMTEKYDSRAIFETPIETYGWPSLGIKADE